MHSATPQQAEPLETVAPRLIGTMEDLISQLRQHGVQVETGDAFVLDATDFPFLTPRSLDGIPLQMNFVGSIPAWSDRVRYHLYVAIAGSRRWSVCEPPKGFNVRSIVARLRSQLDDLKAAQARVEQTALNKELAESRITRLGAALGVFQESPLRLAQDNLKIEGLLDFPNEVQITVRTSHENAERIARDFRRKRGRPKGS